MPYVALLLALSGIAGSLASGPQTQKVLWAPDTFTRAETLDAFQQTMLRNAVAALGTPYHWAGNGSGQCSTGEHAGCFDCSGFVQHTARTVGARLPRTSAAQAAAGRPVPREELMPGDILFFRTDGSATGPVNHCGIYVGNNLFVHAGNRGVRLDDLSSAYWGNPARPRLRGIRRISQPPSPGEGAVSEWKR